MSIALDVERDWNFRKLDKRLVVVETKSDAEHKIVVLDVLTNIMFSVHTSEMFNIRVLTVNGEYIFTLNVYTTKKLEDIKTDFLGFFEAIDVDHNIEDFIKAHWVYPGKIHFDLVAVEEA